MQSKKADLTIENNKKYRYCFSPDSQSVSYTHLDVYKRQEVAASGGIPFYLVQASDRICTSNTGWSSADQISKQIVEAQKVDGYKGSIFNSLTRLAEDRCV